MKTRIIICLIALAWLSACGGGGTETCQIDPHPDERCKNDLPVPCAASATCIK